MKYPDWEAAAKASKSRKAISAGFTQRIPNDGRYLKCAIIKPLHGDPYVVYYHSPGLKVVGLKASAKDVDQVKTWYAF